MHEVQPGRFLLALLFLKAVIVQVEASEATAQGDGPHSKPSKKWRIVNLDAVLYGWGVGELQFFGDAGCSNDWSKPQPQKPINVLNPEPVMTWKPISSGNNNAPAPRVFDGLTWTEWRAQCYMCEPGVAWIGMEFNMDVNVYCVRLYQWGTRDYKTNGFMLQRFEAPTLGTSEVGYWQDVLKGTGLEGETWDSVSFTLCDPLSAPEHGRVAISNGGYFPSSAKFTCSGARLMVGSDTQSCNIDGTWNEDIPTCWPAIALVILISGIFCCEVTAFGSYYYAVVRHKPPPLQSTTFIPDDALNKFNSHELYGINDEDEDDGSSNSPRQVLMHVLGCFCCRIADTWHSVGLLPYAIGVWLPQFCLPFLPCIATAFRMQIRARFQIKGKLKRDLLLWIFCIPCVAMQEARHVDHMCDVAEEEAVVMRRAEERKQEKDRKMREAMAADAHGHKAIGKAEFDEEGNPIKKKPKIPDATHADFIRPLSVMDMLTSV